MIKFRGLAKFEKLLDELMTPRLLTAVFSAIDYRSLQMRPVADPIGRNPF